MTFFFQTNPIRVILKTVLALLNVIIAVGGVSVPVQNTSNKVHTSIIKHASHGSGGGIKSSCSESMCFSKKHICISSIINASLSFLLTVVRGSRFGGWCRAYTNPTGPDTLSPFGPGSGHFFFFFFFTARVGLRLV